MNDDPVSPHKSWWRCGFHIMRRFACITGIKREQEGLNEAWQFYVPSAESGRMSLLSILRKYRPSEWPLSVRPVTNAHSWLLARKIIQQIIINNDIWIENWFQLQFNWFRYLWVWKEICTAFVYGQITACSWGHYKAINWKLKLMKVNFYMPVNPDCGIIFTEF